MKASAPSVPFSKYLTGVLVLCAIAFAPCAQAEVRLASPFTSHMVLQRDRNVPVWGTAAPGEIVTVEFAGQKVSAKADADGDWRVDLKPMKASAESRTLTVTGSVTAQPIRLDNVLVGEVWLASGQSNMDFSVAKTPKFYFAGVTNEAEEVAAANYPTIREFRGEWTRSLEPQKEVAGVWKVCTPDNVREFSAVGYFFARDLQRQLKVPIGILTLTYGASTAEAWVRREALAADPQLKPMLNKFDADCKAFDKSGADRAKLLAQQKANEIADEQARAAGRRPPRHPRNPDPSQNQHNPTVLFNGMIAPVIPYAIRGVFWYQGESIVGGSAGVALYPRVQAALIRDWRKLWGEGDFPFYIVQLAGQEAASNSPWVRAAQATALSSPHTGMAVTTDIGEAHNVHPKDKQDVGDRLSRIALAKVYGRKIEYSGPVYKAMKVEGNKIRVSFTHVDGGLVAKGGGPLKWFEITGADKKFVPADAKIDGDTVVACSPEVPAPVAVRYAWVNFPDGCNLFNAAGLPAPQFRTDNW